MKFRRVIIESPFGGVCDPDIDRNLRYLRACMADCLQRGEAPFASHALYTQPGVLDDKVPAERRRGIAAGFAWREAAEATVVYEDLGVSDGMEEGAVDSMAKNTPVERRLLGGEWAMRPYPERPIHYVDVVQPERSLPALVFNTQGEYEDAVRLLNAKRTEDEPPDHTSQTKVS